jgi:hypothetical protein
MSVDALIARQTSIVQGLLYRTQRGEVRWEMTEEGNFRSVRDRASVIIERLDASSRVRLHFIAADESSVSEIIEQSAADNRLAGDVDRLNNLLTKVWLYVCSNVGPASKPRAADVFLGPGRG